MEGREGREGRDRDHVPTALLVAGCEALDLLGVSCGCTDDEAFLEVDIAQR